MLDRIISAIELSHNNSGVSFAWWSWCQCIHFALFAINQDSAVVCAAQFTEPKWF